MSENLEKIFESTPVIIAGPCAVESREQILSIAESLNKMGINIIRCQLWKPRTEKKSFQGVGEVGIPWLKEAKDKYGMKIATEIVDKDHIALMEGVADILWVGARNMQNYELLKALGGQPKPVILKRGLIATVQEWIAAADYIGRDRVILCERGVRTGADAMRFTLDLNAALVAKHDYGMNVLVDPSHTAGRSDMVAPLALAAVSAGLDGIIVEAHNDPQNALSDKDQQLTLEEFGKLVDDIKKISK